MYYSDSIAMETSYAFRVQHAGLRVVEQLDKVMLGYFLQRLERGGTANFDSLGSCEKPDEPSVKSKRHGKVCLSNVEQIY